MCFQYAQVKDSTAEKKRKKKLPWQNSSLYKSNQLNVDSLMQENGYVKSSGFLKLENSAMLYHYCENVS